MKLTKVGLLMCAALSVATASAADATVYIAYKYGANPLTVVATGATDVSWAGAVAPNLKVNTVTASAGGVPSVLTSLAQVTKDMGGPAPKALDIFVTVDNLSSLAGFFDSGLTENLLVSPWSVTESTFYSTANALFGGTLLASHLFSGPASTSSSDTLSGFLALSSPFSVTHQYHIVAPTVGPRSSALSSISVTASTVPEPATWALMLGGFGLAGLTLRSRPSRASVSYSA